MIDMLCFSAAHLHHFVDHVRNGRSVKDAALIACFQLLYTSLFGAYASFVYLRTGAYCVVLDSRLGHVSSQSFSLCLFLRRSFCLDFLRARVLQHHGLPRPVVFQPGELVASVPNRCVACFDLLDQFAALDIQATLCVLQ